MLSLFFHLVLSSGFFSLLSTPISLSYDVFPPFVSVLSFFFSFVFLHSLFFLFTLFFSKHKTAYELRISYWSSDVCSSDLAAALDQDRLVSHRCCSSPVPPRLHAAGTADLGVSARRELEADHQSVTLDHGIDFQGLALAQPAAGAGRRPPELRQGLHVEGPHRGHADPPFGEGHHDPSHCGVEAHAGGRDVGQPRHQRQILEAVDVVAGADRDGHRRQQADPDDQEAGEVREEPAGRAHGDMLMAGGFYITADRRDNRKSTARPGPAAGCCRRSPPSGKAGRRGRRPGRRAGNSRARPRSEEHTSELKSLMRNTYAAFCVKTK